MELAVNAQQGLSQDALDKLAAWLKEKWQFNGGRCTICNGNNWDIGRHLVAPPTFAGGGVSLGGIVYPQAICTCTTCGHAVYFNAVVIGIVESKVQAAADEKNKTAGGSNG